MLLATCRCIVPTSSGSSAPLHACFFVTGGPISVVHPEHATGCPVPFSQNPQFKEKVVFVSFVKVSFLRPPPPWAIPNIGCAIKGMRPAMNTVDFVMR